MINDHWTLTIPPRWDLWNIHPSVAAGLVLLGGLYAYLGGLRSGRRHVASFFGALVVLFLALNGPLHNLSDKYLFSVHMAQHLLLTLVFPPLLLYGTPAPVVRPLLTPRWVMTVGRAVTKPLPTLSQPKNWTLAAFIIASLASIRATKPLVSIMPSASIVFAI